MAYGEAIAALADPTRRRVFEKLRAGPSPVGVLARGLEVSRPAVSQHLKVLEGAGLVRGRRDLRDHGGWQACALGQGARVGTGRALRHVVASRPRRGRGAGSRGPLHPRGRRDARRARASRLGEARREGGRRARELQRRLGVRVRDLLQGGVLMKKLMLVLVALALCAGRAQAATPERVLRAEVLV